MRIHAYVGRCQGYGNCAALDQEHFSDLDDDGPWSSAVTG